MTRVGKEIKTFNEQLKDVTLKNGGNWFALHSYVPTSMEQNQPAAGAVDGQEAPLNQALPSGSSICSLYEDGVHAGLLLRKLVLNNLFNLHCKKLKSLEKRTPTNDGKDFVQGWAHRRYDAYTQGTVELVDGGLIQIHPPSVSDGPAKVDTDIHLNPLSLRPTLEVLNRSPEEVRHCLNTQYGPGKKPIVFLGNSNARALYFTFLNLAIERYPSMHAFPENRLQSKRICDPTVQLRATKDTLKPSCPVVATPPIDSLIQFVWSRSVWDSLVSSVFDSEPAVLINMAGYTELLSTGGDHAEVTRVEGQSLSHAVRNFVLKGHTYIELTLPPICESKARSVVKNPALVAQNRLINRVVSSSGGSIFDTSSFVPGVPAAGDDWNAAMEDPKNRNSNGCSQYEDGTHPNIAIRKDIVNSLWNLLCQPELKQPFYFKKGDRMHLDDAKTKN
jgi:hypothetical protein